MNIIAIGDRMMSHACQAGGIRDSIPCKDAKEARSALEEVIAQEGTGVVFVLDRYLADIPLPPAGGAYPVIIGIPGPEGAFHGEDAVTSAVRKVAGRHMQGAER